MGKTAVKRHILRAKIHRARITRTALDYNGSITIDRALMRAADMCEYEKVLVVNLTNGTRHETYAIAGDEGSGQICINGAAAHLCEVGEEVIIMAFATVDEKDLEAGWLPRIVLVDENNRPVTQKGTTVCTR